ncbi:hypothetical protein B0H12DRAFT_735879 [Mycena haematopus]|nr:hypothetical protein B0H12DRAFT_735879 [Mycena haematopus]
MPALRVRATHTPVRSPLNTARFPPSPVIIAPTPRTFTFAGHNQVSASPSHSPSKSPFEHDLRAVDLSRSSPSTPVSLRDVECRSAPPQSTFSRIVFPVSETKSSSPARQMPYPTSRAGTPIEERRPKKGDDDYVKRPENSFILFRRQCCEDLAAASALPSPASASTAPKKHRQADLSRTISQRWKALSPEERSHWEALANEKKREHEQLHPNYVYRPRRTGAKNRSSVPSAAEPASISMQSSAPPLQATEFVLPRAPAHSATAPTSLPIQASLAHAQSTSVPGAGDSGDDPMSLMAMMLELQRGVENQTGGFDYVPTKFGIFEPSSLLPPPPPAAVGGALLSPASSADSSPYTLCTSFPPSVFTSTSFADTQPPAAPPDDMGLGLYEPAASTQAVGDSVSGYEYTQQAPAWFVSSPWSSELCRPAAGDFELTQISGVQLAFPGGETVFQLPGGDAEFEFIALQREDAKSVDGEFNMNAPDFSSGASFEDVFSLRA